MSRRCFCERLMRRMEDDVRLRTLPMAAQLLWLKLMRLVANSAEPGILRLGSDFGFLQSVSLAVSHAETEVETALAALERRGLVERMEAEGALVLPDAVDGGKRVEAARSNGLRGGRPRKDETRDAYLARRQGRLMMPIEGGKADVPETQAKPKPESSCVAAKPLEEKEGKQAAREAEGWVSVGNALAEIAGMDPVRGGFNVMPAKGWMEAGASADLLREVFRKVVARPSYPKAGARSLMYFNDAVREAIATGASGAAPAADADPYAEIDKRWRVTVAHWDHSRGVPPSREAFRSMAA